MTKKGDNMPKKNGFVSYVDIEQVGKTNWCY